MSADVRVTAWPAPPRRLAAGSASPGPLDRHAVSIRAASPSPSSPIAVSFRTCLHHRLGHRDEARDCFDRSTRWVKEQRNLNAENARELDAFRAEAEAVLAGPAGDLPDDVFANPRR